MKYFTTLSLLITLDHPAVVKLTRDQQYSDLATPSDKIAQFEQDLMHAG